MKKLMISTSVLVGVAVLGGGYWLWPSGSQSSTPVATTETSAVATKKVTSHAAKSQTVGTSAAATSSSKGQSATSTTSRAATGTSQSQATSKQTTSSTATAGSAANTSATATSQTLTADQINDWVWQQLAPEYQGTQTTKANIGFNQTKKSDGLIYIEARETSNDQVSHLAGLFRVNANGQLEKQDTAKGADVWDIVSSTYN